LGSLSVSFPSPSDSSKVSIEICYPTHRRPCWVLYSCKIRKIKNKSSYSGQVFISRAGVGVPGSASSVM
ncbi:MAG: hypothetical protein WCF23_19800, partial [Candidatus Nitrosopolaris sp.]